MSGYTRLFYFLVPALVAAIIFSGPGCTGSSEIDEPGRESGETPAETEPADKQGDPEQATGEEDLVGLDPFQDTPLPAGTPPGPDQRTESTFEHRVEMDIEGRVETGRGDQWWDMEMKNGEEWWDLD